MLPRPEASLSHFKSSGRPASVSDSVGGGTWGQRVRAGAAEECAASSERLAWEKSWERMEQGAGGQACSFFGARTTRPHPRSHPYQALPPRGQLPAQPRAPQAEQDLSWA